MTASELRAFERISADAFYLARLMERTMAVDAKTLASERMIRHVQDAQEALRAISELCETHTQMEKFMLS